MLYVWVVINDRHVSEQMLVYYLSREFVGMHVGVCAVIFISE